MTTFVDFDLPPYLMQALEAMQITAPTAVQMGSIPPALKGQDILASAQTGSGKTMAYLIPLMVNLMKAPQSRALILLPTRELAQQVRDAFYQLASRLRDLRATVIIGGEPIRKQFFELKRNPQLIIGTPGRICDHLDRQSLFLDDMNFFVLDEVDRMLDMGFSDELEMIYHRLPKTRQTFMFSATLPNHIEKLAQKYLSNPERITVGSSKEAALDIKQEVLHTHYNDKYSQLVRQLNEREGSVIVFVKTKHGADALADKLKRENHSAEAIHGDLQQRQRERVILAFRNQKNRIMVATDIAARGLDVPHIQHVINYDLPNCAEDYIHRIGRTGRAGSKGFALSLVTPDEIRKWKIIHRAINPGEAAAQDRDRPARAYEPRRGNAGNGGGNSYRPARPSNDFARRESSGGGRGRPQAQARDGRRGDR